jgi:hypothetical protein
MGIVRFALKFPYTFYALAAFIVFLGALQAVEDKLLLKDEFVLRYDIENPSDGLPAGEGAFLACSFRLVDNCILEGMCTKARAPFYRLLSHCSDVGLLSEEIDPLSRRMLGDFPRDYSHIGLINCAPNLSRQTGLAEKRAKPRAPSIVTPAAESVVSAASFDGEGLLKCLGERDGSATIGVSP